MNKGTHYRDIILNEDMKANGSSQPSNSLAKIIFDYWNAVPLTSRVDPAWLQSGNESFFVTKIELVGDDKLRITCHDGGDSLEVEVFEVEDVESGGIFTLVANHAEVQLSFNSIWMRPSRIVPLDEYH